MRNANIHDKVLLNSGELAYISKVYSSGVAYQAMIQTFGGLVLDTILQKNIVRVYPFSDIQKEKYA